MELNNEELKLVTGGAIKTGIFIIIGGALTLIVGIIDGYFRPLKCNK